MAKKKRTYSKNNEEDQEKDASSQSVVTNRERQKTDKEGRATPKPDGTIQFEGHSIGPFIGEWQGRSRNQIIASHLSEITAADRKNTRIEPMSGGIRVYLGDISIALLSADISAMGLEKTPGVSKEYAAALHLIQQLDAQPPKQSLAEERGELALKQAKITYTDGKKQVGSGSWETRGRNSGSLLDEINSANHAGSGYEWCGMYIGHAYKKAGIRPEILRSLVFWSGYRLHLFFTRGVDVANKSVGSFWEAHQYRYLPLNGGEDRKKFLENFDPKPGDVVLFGASPYNHVAMVSSYNHDTGVLELMEGNSGNRVQATAFGSNFGNISFIGRFNNSDYGGPADKNLQNAKSPNVPHTDRRTGQVS